MALDKQSTLLLLRLVTRLQNKLKGEALDLARAAFPETPTDRQFSQFERTIKSKEQALRAAFMEAALDSGLIEAVSTEELQNFK